MTRAVQSHRASKVFTVVENTKTDVPIGELLRDGELDLYEGVLAAGFFGVSLKGKVLQLTAGDFVGYIPLNGRVALLVEPKIGKANLLHLVARAGGRLRELAFLRDYATSDVAARSIVEFLSRSLVLQLADLEREGMNRQYLPLVEVSDAPTGKIKFAGSIRRVWSRGQSRSIESERYLLSKDTMHNRLIKVALRMAVFFLSALPESSRDLGQNMAELEDLFAQVPLDWSPRLRERVNDSLRESSIPNSRKFYEEICRTALLLVEHSGLVPSALGEGETLTFVVNMADIFERYCYELIRERAAELGGTAVVSKEGASKPLFDMPAADSRSASPDLVLRMASGEAIPVDVKYKEEPTRTDINQVVTYALSYRSRNAVLLCYADRKFPPGWELLGRIGGAVDVRVYRMELEGVDLGLAEDRLIYDIGELARTVSREDGRAA